MYLNNILINLRKLAEQQKEQGALKIKYIILKQTHDVKLAENLSPITKKIDEEKNYSKIRRRYKRNQYSSTSYRKHPTTSYRKHSNYSTNINY